MKRGMSSLRSVPEGPSARYNPSPPMPALITHDHRSCDRMVLRDYTAELNLPSVSAALALASIFSNYMTITSQQDVKMIA
jgi:hypothetical protein